MLQAAPTLFRAIVDDGITNPRLEAPQAGNFMAHICVLRFCILK
jgi:hypothetical protein